MESGLKNWHLCFGAFNTDDRLCHVSVSAKDPSHQSKLGNSVTGFK